MALLMTLGRGHAMSTPDALPSELAGRRGKLIDRHKTPADRTSCIHRARSGGRGQEGPAGVDGPVRRDALLGIQAKLSLGYLGLISIG